MRNYPAGILEAIKLACENHPTDIKACISEANSLIESSSDLDAFLSMVREATIEQLVYDQRHRINRQIKKAAGLYKTQDKVNIAASRAVGEVYESVFMIRIAGTILGELRGSQLEGIAKDETARCNGHRFNAELLYWLSDRVAPHQKVSEAIPARELYQKFQSLHKEVFSNE